MIGVVIPEEVSIFIGLFRIFLIRGRVCGKGGRRREEELVKKARSSRVRRRRGRRWEKM